MAKYEKSFQGDFDTILDICYKSVMRESATASYEDSSYWISGDVRAAVRVFERFSYTGGNRVSLTVTLIGNGNDLFLSAISSGGSQGVFFKFNKWGEQSFLDTLIRNIEQYTT